VDSDKIEACLNTARRMTLGFNNRRDATTAELHDRMPIPNAAGQIQQRRMNLWANMHKRPSNFALKVSNSKQTNKNRAKKAYSKDWKRQIQADAKQNQQKITTGSIVRRRSELHLV
jgi:hypothetical protein